METFGEIVRLWLADVVGRLDLSPSTKICYRRVAKRLAAWGDEVGRTCVDLAPFVVLRSRTGLSPRTMRLELRIASAAFHWGQKHGSIATTALMWTPRVKVDREMFWCNHRTPSVDEVTAVIAAMPDDDWRLAVKLLARTGARAGEVVALRVRDFDDSGPRLAFGAVQGASKTGMRWFPLDADSARELRGRTGTGSLLDFGASVAQIQGLQRRLRAAAAVAGVPAFTPHGLRRMVVTRLLRAGVNPGTAATLTGHTVEVMLRYYQQVSDEDRRAAVVLAGLGRV